MCLTREQFRSQTFARDNNTCVIPGCGRVSVDPHHLIERSLWLKDDPCPEGYLLDNGASLCEIHHIHAEENYYPPQALRHWIGTPIVLPKQLDTGRIWDKWGEEIPASPNTKWPRTPYLSFSPTIDPDDDLIESSEFINKPLVITIKMDGANVTISKDKVTARNGDTANHPQFDPLKALHASFKWSIPEGVILYGEWLFAQHSIHYKKELALASPLMIFGIYEPENQLLWSWQEVVSFCQENGFVTVPTIKEIQYDAEWKFESDTWKEFEKVVSRGHEGIVIRNSYPIHHGQWNTNSGKMVRDSHNQSEDWKNKPIIKNQTI